MYSYDTASRPGWVVVEGGALDWPLALKLARDELNRPIVKAVSIEPEEGEILPTTIRALPLGDILRDIQRRLDSDDPMAQFVARAMLEVSAGPRRGLRSTLGPAHYRRVAALVQSSPDLKPVDALKAQWPDTTTHTLRRWLRTAELMGLLGTEQS